MFIQICCVRFAYRHVVLICEDVLVLRLFFHFFRSRFELTEIYGNGTVVFFSSNKLYVTELIRCGMEKNGHFILRKKNFSAT